MRRYALTYPEDAANGPLLAKAILETKVLVNVLFGKTENSSAQLVISILGGQKEQKTLIGFLQMHGANVVELKGEISKNKDRCVDCCACYGVCPTVQGLRRSLPHQGFEP
jgi:NAD-dependent dihydropyrimidine dehydrogenase PreA subunit